MEKLEQPRKKIKVDLDENARAENGSVTQSSNATSPAKGESSGGPAHLQFNPTVIERLRKITKQAQKNFPNSKSADHRPEAAARNGDVQLVNGESSGAKQQPANDDNEFIASSTGSSPARSPKLSDLTKLSTPPRPAKSFDGAKFGQRLLSKLEEEFSTARDDNSESTLGSPGCCVNRQEDVKRSRGSGVIADTIKNGDSWANCEPVVTVVEEKPTSGLTETAPVGRRRGSRDFNSVEVRRVIRKLLDEKMTKMVAEITEDTKRPDLKERMSTLEAENKSLHNYATRLENTVKQLQAKQTSRRDRVSRWAQTDPVVFSPSASTASAAGSSGVKSSAGPTSTGAPYVLNVSTGSTTRITSTVAPLPGHTLPRAVEAPANIHGTRTITVQATEPHPVRPAGMAHRQPATVPMQRFPSPSYQPLSQAQPARPIPPRAPLPTVTVRPQTQTQPPPPSSPGAQAPFHRPPPPPYAYQGQSVAQTVYSNAHPTPTPLPQRHPAPSMVAATVRAQAPPLQVQPPPPRFQSSLAQGAHVQSQTPYVVRSSPAQHPPPAYTHQEHNRLQTTAVAADGRPVLVAASLPPQPRPAVQPPRAALPIRPPAPAVRMQAPPVPVSPSAAVNPAALKLRGPPPPPGPQQSPLVCAPAAADNPAATNFIQAESRAVQPAASSAAAAQQNVEVRGSGTDPPPKPTVSIAVVMSGIVLSWNMSLSARHSKIVSYQLFALQDGNNPTGAANQWKKIGVVKALPLPMACTLTQFLPGNKYHFAVRASDSLSRSGPFSEPCTITLK